MTDTTFEEAKRCPICSVPGQVLKRSGRMHTFICENDRCQKNGRTWVVEPRSDGSLPDPNRVIENPFHRHDRVLIDQRIAGMRALADQDFEGNELSKE